MYSLIFQIARADYRETHPETVMDLGAPRFTLFGQTCPCERYGCSGIAVFDGRPPCYSLF